LEWVEVEKIVIIIKWIHQDKFLFDGQLLKFFSRNKFYPASDVWSFGILVFEIFSDGEKPYGRFDSSQQVVDYVLSKKIFEKSNAELMLKEYLKLFGDFTKTALSVSRICRYLQRYWIPGNLWKTPSNIEVREIYPLALVMWRQHCFDPIKDKLIPSLLDLLDQDRNGNKQDKTLIRNMVQSYIEFDKVGPNEGQQFYEKEFEAKYIDRIKHFYAAESTQFLAANGVSLFLQKAESRIEEEKANSEYLGNYLTTSEPKIKKAIDEVLIEKKTYGNNSSRFS